MVTMADVARQAGVSVTTVSHVLNETRFVRAETSRRILAAIEDTGYIHNTIARSLVTSNTRTIGLAISAISNPYFIDLVHVIESELHQAGYSMLLADTREDPEVELLTIQLLHQRRADGYLLAPTGGRVHKALGYLIRHNLPTVLVDRLASDRFDQVGTENVEAAAQLVQHLADHGHRRIALICGLEALSTTDERVAGYRQGLKKAGLSFDPAIVVSGASDAGPAYEAALEVLDLPEPPTAIVAANNRMTIGAMRALRERGMTVPRDIALVAFDDFEWSELFQPRLTVIAQPIVEIGTQAVRMLMDRLAEPTRTARTMQLVPTFVQRESCGCPPITGELGTDMHRGDDQQRRTGVRGSPRR